MLHDAVARAAIRATCASSSACAARPIASTTTSSRALAAGAPQRSCRVHTIAAERVWPGRRGYVQTHVRELFGELAAKNEGAPHAYICGLERMVSSVRDLLRKEMGLPREQVHSERYD